MARGFAAGWGLYAELRWRRAVTIDPFVECRVPHDQTPAWCIPTEDTEHRGP